MNEFFAADIRIRHKIGHDHADDRGKKGREQIDIQRVPDHLEHFGVGEQLPEYIQAEPPLR